MLNSILITKLICVCELFLRLEAFNLRLGLNIIFMRGKKIMIIKSDKYNYRI